MFTHRVVPLQHAMMDLLAESIGRGQAFALRLLPFSRSSRNFA